MNPAVKNGLKVGGLGIAACAACCAPILIAPVAGLIAAGGAGLALAGQVGLGVLVIAGVGGYVVLRRRQAAAQKAAASCNCAPDAGCNVGDACELPVAEAKAAGRQGAIC